MEVNVVFRPVFVSAGLFPPDFPVLQIFVSSVIASFIQDKCFFEVSSIRRRIEKIVYFLPMWMVNLILSCSKKIILVFAQVQRINKSFERHDSFFVDNGGVYGNKLSPAVFFEINKPADSKISKMFAVLIFEPIGTVKSYVIYSRRFLGKRADRREQEYKGCKKQSFK